MFFLEYTGELRTILLRIRVVKYNTHPHTTLSIFYISISCLNFSLGQWFRHNSLLSTCNQQGSSFVLLVSLCQACQDRCHRIFHNLGSICLTLVKVHPHPKQFLCHISKLDHCHQHHCSHNNKLHILVALCPPWVHLCRPHPTR
jgi:hypothetical protein